jgi:hypothetical protein
MAIGVFHVLTLCIAKLTPGGLMLTLRRTISPAIEKRHSQWWCRHFLRNVDRQLPIPWNDVQSLDQEKARVLIPSLQDFQLGESSEGKHGRARAAAYGEAIGDPHYAEAVRLFFAEENRHAAYLARYLASHQASLLARSWTDFVFRRVRRLMGLETLNTVLLTAELIGETYYTAIRAATSCAVLRAICTQLLRDERMHVRFHVERFRLLRRGRSHARNAIQDSVWAAFFWCTRLAVWAKHRGAFRFGGYGFRRYWDESSRRFQGVLSAIARRNAQLKMG